MSSRCGHHGIHLLQIVIFASMAMPVVFSAGSISPPADYFVQEGIWVKEHGTQSDAWVTTPSLQERLLLSGCQSKLDIAYVIRTANAGHNVNATFILFRNSDTHRRFDGNGTILETPVSTGCGSAQTVGGVLPFWNLTLCMDHAEYDKGYHYFLFLTTFDPRRYSGTYQLRVNVSGLGGGSSWTSPAGNPNCPWIFFEVPSQGMPTIDPFSVGEPLRASSRVNITCANLPVGRSPPREDYEIFIDYTSFTNGSYYGSGFFRNGSQLPRWLQPGWHTMTVVGGEIVASVPFHTSQWEVSVEAWPSSTIPNGVPVNITGSGFPVNESYTVFLVTPKGTESQILGGAISKFGDFSTSFRFPKETGLGLHGIRAVSTKVSGPPTATAYVEIDPWTVNLTVSPTSFHQGGWLDINGSLYPVDANIEIYLDGDTVHQCRTDENGTFHHRMYTLTEDFAPGIHVVTANATDYGGPPCGRVEISVLGYNASIKIGDAVTNPGRRLSMNGSGFPPNELVKIELGPILLGEVVTGSKGIFQAECIIPPEHPLGNHTISALAPRHGGPPTGTAAVRLVQWPLQVAVNPLGPHPGGWIRITGSGLPPEAPFRWSLGGTIILQGTSDPDGTFDGSPSLPQNLTKGLHNLDFVVSGYSGPPSASFSLNIADWMPTFEVTPTAPRPGEALWLAGSGFPRGRRYNITLDGVHRGTGKIDQEGKMAAYLFLRRNISLGAHRLNMSIDFAGIASIPIDLQVVPWTTGLNLSPLWGKPGSTVELHAFGFPPGSSLEIAWGGIVLSSVEADLSGAYTGCITVPDVEPDTYHTLSVECPGYTGPPSASASFRSGTIAELPSLLPCGSDGSPRFEFFPDEEIDLIGSGFPPSIRIRVALVDSSTGALALEAHATVDGSGEVRGTLAEDSTFPGAFFLVVDANSNGVPDANDFVAESRLRVRPRPALSVQGLAVDRTKAKEGETVGIDVAVRNDCGQPEMAILHVSHGDQAIRSLPLVLPSGETLTYHIDWDTTGTIPGRNPVVAAIDPIPGELDLSDNRLEGGSLLVEPAPDIAIRSIAPDQREARIGTVINVRFTVDNLVSVQQPFSLELLWGDTLVATRSLNVAGLASQTGTLQWDTGGLPPGEERIRMRTSSIPNEINTADNDHAAGSVRILPPNAPPLSVPGGPYTGLAGLPLTLDGSLSEDADGQIVEYLWTFHDSATSAMATVDRTYGFPGTYEVNLTVIDNEGFAASNTTEVVIVDPSEFSIWASDSSGSSKMEFEQGEPVFATVRGPVAWEVLVYLVLDGCQGQGSKLFDVSHGPTRLSLASEATAKVCSPASPGVFALVLDLNSNGIYEPELDRAGPSFHIVSEGWVAFGLLLIGAVAILSGRSPGFRG